MDQESVDVMLCVFFKFQINFDRVVLFAYFLLLNDYLWPLKHFDLKTGTHRPYRKPSNTPLCIHTSSNHPHQILKRLPLSINQRLPRNSSNSIIFDQCRDEYEVGRKMSGYKNIHLSYIDRYRTKCKSSRRRNIMWFNPTFSKNVSSNIAK